MKNKIKIACIILLTTSLSACGIFKPGCGCPKVSTTVNHPQIHRNS